MYSPCGLAKSRLTFHEGGVLLSLELPKGSPAA
jgi:hypothetical protein